MHIQLWVGLVVSTVRATDSPVELTPVVCMFDLCLCGFGCLLAASCVTVFKAEVEKHAHDKSCHPGKDKKRKTKAAVG